MSKLIMCPSIVEMHMCVKFEVSITNMPDVIDINVAKREQMWW